MQMSWRSAPSRELLSPGRVAADAGVYLIESHRARTPPAPEPGEREHECARARPEAARGAATRESRVIATRNSTVSDPPARNRRMRLDAHSTEAPSSPSAAEARPQRCARAPFAALARALPSYRRELRPAIRGRGQPALASAVSSSAFSRPLDLRLGSAPHGQHRLGRPAVLSLQAIESGQSLLEL